jgi:preprotein translocase subunit SecY
MALLVLTTGTIFLMWLGEQIDEYGIGNGISLIIMAGIVARMPNAVIYVFQNKAKIASARQAMDQRFGSVLPDRRHFVGVVAGSILITQAQRRIPIQQAKQTRGRRVVRWSASVPAVAGEPRRRHADHFRQLDADLPGHDL